MAPYALRRVFHSSGIGIIARTEAAARTSYLAKRHSASERRSAVQRSVIRSPHGVCGEPGLQSEWPDLKQAHIIKTGDRSYCLC